MTTKTALEAWLVAGRSSRRKISPIAQAVKTLGETPEITKFLTRTGTRNSSQRSHVGGNMSNDVEPAAVRWRKLAAEMLAAAAEMTDPDAYAVMVDIAERYERLARYAEERPDKEEPK